MRELFITSKMWVQDMQNYETAKAAIDASLDAMGLDYLDLYLLHQAMKGLLQRLAGHGGRLQGGQAAGHWGQQLLPPHTLTNFCETVEIKPMVNQVELHPYFTQENRPGDHGVLRRSAGGLGALGRWPVQAL